jgi:hypothetical protein
MRKPRAKTKHEPLEDDLPAELDPKKLKFVGFGLDALRKHAAAKRRTVELEPDLARDFPDAKAVNSALRTLREIQRMVQPAKQRRTA